MVLTQAVAERLWPREDGKFSELKGCDSKLSVVQIGSDDESESIIVPEIFVPLRTATELLEKDTYDEISVRSINVGKTSEVAASIKNNFALRAIPDDTLDDFRIRPKVLTRFQLWAQILGLPGRFTVT